MKIRDASFAALTLAFLTFSEHSMGETIQSTYTGDGADNLWFNPANWNPARSPSNDGTDDFLITIPDSSGTIVLNSSSAFTSLAVGSGSEISISQHQALFPTNAIENNGLITFLPAPGNQRLQTSFNGSITLAGTGILRGAGSNSTAIIAGQNGTNMLTNGAGHTIEGFGILDVSIETIVNSGLINANVNGQTLDVRSSVVDLDGGELRAESGGTLSLTDWNANITGQNGGFISVGDGSLVLLANRTISNTSLLAIDADDDLSNNRMRVTWNSTINNVTNEARLEVSDATNSRRLFIEGQIVNNGEIIALKEGNGVTGITVNGNATLAGTGKVVLNDWETHSISGTNFDDVLHHGEGHTIEGSGIIGTSIETLTNAGLIHSNQGGTLTINAGFTGETFINEPSGILRVSNSGVMKFPGFASGQTFINRGLVDVGPDSYLDAAYRPIFWHLTPTSISMEAGEIRSNGTFETDVLIAQSGIISGGGIFRARTTDFGENVIIRPGDGAYPGIGTLSFRDSAPTELFPECGGIWPGPESIAPYSDVVHFDGSTFEFDIESPASHDRIEFGGNSVHAIGSIRLKLNLTGPPSGFSASDRIVLVSGIGFPQTFRGEGPGQYTVECGDSTYLVHPGKIGGLTITNLPAGDRLSSHDGRVSFKVEFSGTTGIYGLAQNELALTEFSLSSEVQGQEYHFTVNPANPVGSIIATISAPETINGTPTFSIIGDAPFEIDSETGEITIATALDPFSGPRVFDFTVNIFDGTSFQVNPTTITLHNNGTIVHDLLTGPGGPFEGQTNPLVVGPHADPDGDGVSNVFELWFGTDPSIPNPAPSIVIGTIDQDDEKFGTLDVTVDAAIDDLISMDGAFGFDLSGFRHGVRHVTSNGATRSLRFIDTLPIPGDKLFGRVEFDPNDVKE